MPFESPDYALADLLNGVATGKIQLPDFQREWKWDDERIASLLASICLGHPVGVVMMLESGGEDVNFATRPIAGVNPSQRTLPERLLLDGQQRLTSLFQALRSGQPVDTTDSRGKKLRRWYYVDINRALADDGDLDEAILSVPEDRVVRADFGRSIVADYSAMELECAAEIFPLNQVFDPAHLFAWQGKYVATDPEHASQRIERWNTFYARVLQNVIGYVVPVIVLKKETPKEAVCTVFEKVNTGGVPLNVFELLTATFASKDFRLNDDWTVRRARLFQHKVLSSIESTDFLQVIALLTTRARRQSFEGNPTEAPGISCKRRDILRLSLDDYLKWAEPVTEALLWAAEFFAQEHIFRSDDLPYRTQLVPLAAMRVVVGEPLGMYAQKEKLRQWYWCGVLGEIYGSTVETRAARDLEQFEAWAKGGPEPGTVVSAAFHAARLLTLRSRTSAAYKGVYALLMRDGACDWAKHQPIEYANFFPHRIDIHHVFPKAWCEKNGVEAGRCDSIVNKTAISYDTNRSIGGRAPSAYLSLLEKKAGIGADKMDDIVATHRIHPAHLRSDDFDSFFNHRAEELLKLISLAMGKEATREQEDEGDLTAFEPELEELEDVDPGLEALEVRILVEETRLLVPQYAMEVRDERSGEVLAEADALWDDGLRAEEPTRTAFLFSPDEEMESRLAELGYRCLVGIDQLEDAATLDSVSSSQQSSSSPKPPSNEVEERAARALDDLVTKSGGPGGTEYVKVGHIEVLKELFNDWAKRYGEPTEVGVFFPGRPGLWHALDELCPLAQPSRWNTLRFAVIDALERDNWLRRSPPRGSAFDVLDLDR